MRCLFFLFSLALVGQETMLAQAESLAKKFNFEIAKQAPPNPSPQTLPCLSLASAYFTLDLNQIEPFAFETLCDEEFWGSIKNIGVEAIHLKNLKKGSSNRTGISLNPEWGSDWNSLAVLLQKKGFFLIGDSMANATGLGPDFLLALKNVGDYPSLYHLIEIEKKDWKNLPQLSATQLAVNIPWLTLQELQHKGYVPEKFTPYVKLSSWNATGQIQGEDGKVRRWIYLKENELDPVIDWLGPSFAGFRIASSDLIDSMYNLGQKLISLPAPIPLSAKQTLSLWIRKLGGFTLQECQGGLEELKTSPSDLVFDTLTRPALLHALLTQDAESLRLMYRLLLEEEFETKRFVHTLQPFDAFKCEWSELTLNPRKKFQYYEEILTGETLNKRLLKEDLAILGGAKPVSWPSYCALSMGYKDLYAKREDLAELHLLLAFFYAMQPGAFSFSLEDLLGLTEPEKIDLSKPAANAIYPSLKGQMQLPKSFAQGIRKLLDIRREYEIAFGELIAVPMTRGPGLLILIHKIRNQIALTALNFAKSKAEQILELPQIRGTTAIDLMTGRAENKPLESSTLQLKLPPLSGKVLLFQTKYYD